MTLTCIISFIFCTTIQIEIAHSLDYVGRVDCEDTGRECLGKNFNRRECRQDLGDARSIPGTNLLVHEILDFFSDNFGFDAQETVALMGVSRFHRFIGVLE